MSLRTYLRLLRLPALLLRAAGIVCLGFALNRFAPGAAQRAGIGTFVVLILFVPFFAGRELSRALHAVLHRPFSPLLPNLRSNLLRWHLPLLALLALASAAVVHCRDGDIPWPANACVAFAALCLSLPLEARGRWGRVKWLGSLLVATVLVVAMNGRSAHAWLQAWPWTSATFALAAAFYSCRAAFDRERIRARAHTLFIDFAELFDPQALQTLARDQIGRSRKSTRAWPVAHVGNSTREWMRVVLHETFGFRGGWRFYVAATTGAAAAAVLAGLGVERLFEPAARNLPFGALLYVTVWAPVKGMQIGGSNAALLTIPLLIATLGAALPRAGRLYLVSRRRQAQVAFWLALLQAATQLAAITGTFVLLAWIGAKLGHVDFTPVAAPRCVAAGLALLPLFPWVLWVRFRFRVKATYRWSDFLLIAVAFGLAGAVAEQARNWLVSAPGLALVLATTLAGLLLYRAALRRFYRTSDLVESENSAARIPLL